MEIDQFLELARKRRSIRQFRPDPVPDELVEKILEAARWAMSGANGQPWEFIVVRDKKLMAQLFEAGSESERQTAALETSRTQEMRQPWYRNLPETVPASRFSDAPVILAVLGDPRTAQATVLNRLCDRRWVVDENIANATQIIHLAAAACGLGSQWVTVDRYFEDLIRPILRVPPILRIFSLVPLGFPALEPKKPYRRALQEIVHRDTYDMGKYRSHEAVQEFIRDLRQHSKRAYPLNGGVRD
ncbi:MAG: nitroreductase family protein [Deltaproteobacteria bacterium]|nr:nitroreductase family protein [Deltaproteobacteria bacterium]